MRGSNTPTTILVGVGGLPLPTRPSHTALAVGVLLVGHQKYPIAELAQAVVDAVEGGGPLVSRGRGTAGRGKDLHEPNTKTNQKQQQRETNRCFTSL